MGVAWARGGIFVPAKRGAVFAGIGLAVLAASNAKNAYREYHDAPTTRFPRKCKQIVFEI